MPGGGKRRKVSSNVKVSSDVKKLSSDVKKLSSDVNEVPYVAG